MLLFTTPEFGILSQPKQDTAFRAIVCFGLQRAAAFYLLKLILGTELRAMVFDTCIYHFIATS
jgi:hypothetical protein